MIGQGAQNCPNYEYNSQHKRTPITSINAFSDDLFLKIFYHCRPVLSDEHGADDNLNSERREWANERWWYKLAHVCRKWRDLVLASASHLRLCLLCTYGTPVADMLRYPPALPLIIDYGNEGREVTAQDEEGILLALRRRRRVRRIRLWMCAPAPSLRRLLATMDGEFQMLENLYVKPLTNDGNELALPNTFNAPHIRHFALRNVTYPPDMFRPPPRIPHLSSTGKSNQFVLSYGPQLWRFLKMFIHILDNDSLLNVFHFCRPVMVDEDEKSSNRIQQGGKWVRERWWYKLAHVCRRWRCLILASASYLNLCLVCTCGTPVSDMIANSPPLPLIIDHIHKSSTGNISAEDEDGIMLALQHRDRVCRIRLQMPLLDLQKLLLAVAEEFPMLEYLYIAPQTKCGSFLTLSHTLQAPHLRQLILLNFAFLTRPPLITSSTGLVTFSLRRTPQSGYSHPSDLLQQIALMPQLETLRITFHSPVPNRDLERQLIHRPVTTHVTLPNLRWLGLRAPSTYMEALLCRMTTPLLERLEARFFLQLNFSIPHLLEFMGSAENLSFGSARFQFFDHLIYVHMYPRDGSPMYSFGTDIICGHLDWQVSFAAQIFRTLGTIFSAVEHLTLVFRRNPDSQETNNDVDPTQWRELLRPFSNVKILCVSEDFRGQISRSLQVVDEDYQVEFLPELKELQFAVFRSDPNAFNAFIDTRRNAGRPITLVRY